MKLGTHRSMEKAFRILELLGSESPRSLAEIAGESGLGKSGVCRLLKSLAGIGYVVQAGDRGDYALSPKVLALAESYLAGDRLARESRAVLRALAGEARASAHLAVFAGGQALVLVKEASPEPIQVATRVGSPIPLHASAVGKVLLAALPEDERASVVRGPLERFTERTITDRRLVRAMLAEVRARGYALEAGEEHPGVGCIGVPVKDAAGRWIAALSVSGPLKGTPFRLDVRHIRLARRAAESISGRLRGPESRTA
jgi:IclR family acetate operon transcriptional repressor